VSALLRSPVSLPATGFPRRAGVGPRPGGAHDPVAAAPQERTGGSGLALAAVLLLLAVLVAPERPLDQEAICQRHNGVAACRVW
jgi:hypothetical protein